MAWDMASRGLKNIGVKRPLKGKASVFTTKRDQKWIDEADASGPETPLTKKKMIAIRNRVLTGV
jgi:hypothetical protein